MRKIIPAILLLAVTACSGNKAQSAAADSQPAQHAAAQTPAGNFSADSAYSYIQRQLAFGPRVPGSAGHRACGQWLEDALGQWADTVITQRAEVTAFNGDRLPLRNIIASFNPQAAERTLLVAHWDTRPWADADSDNGNHDKPIPGANDGGSGVGVLLEIARNLAARAPSAGVDIFLTDAEDYGQSGGDDSDDSWCLGTQYYTGHMPAELGRPHYAIVLDMVGGRGATFKREYFSDQYARPYVDKVWQRAAKLGFSDRFVDTAGPGIIDDHVYLLRGGIPAIDIVECENAATGSFPPQWHTMADDIDAIDTSTLHAVGTTVLDLLY